MSTAPATKLPTTRKWTAEDLLQLPEDLHCELIDGELMLMAPAGDEHGAVGSNLGFLITAFVRQRRLGQTYTSDTGFILSRDPDTTVAPDASFVRAERVRRGERGFFPGAPDLAVEVVSPDDKESDVMDKVRRYLAAGSGAVWVVWPSTRSITVHRTDAATLILHESDRLDGGDVLPGFSCDVREIFE